MSLLGSLGAALAAFKKPKEIPIDAADLELATTGFWWMLGLLALFFLVRPELWRRLWLQKSDPRGAGVLRILLGITVFWTMADLLLVGRALFTDEGLWLTEMARHKYGAVLKTQWDPEHGLEHWTDIFDIVWNKWTILHVRSDPQFVFTIWGCCLLSCLLMIFGVWTRVTTILTWILVNQLYNYSPVYYAGGDTVLRCMLFLSIFLRWGEAYSIDSWLRRRRAVLKGGSKGVPGHRPIPQWPMRLMMMQLAIIYCSTGLLKSGRTWIDGSAIYYAMQLDHFYRVPTTGLTTFLYWAGPLRVATVVVHWWEILFPLLLVGLSLRAYERGKKDGTWPETPAWRRGLSYAVLAALGGVAVYLAFYVGFYYYDPKFFPPNMPQLSPEQAGIALSAGVALVLAVPVGGYLALRRYWPKGHAFLLEWILSRRFWLGLGLAMHLGIEAAMNVGTFVQVMIASYAIFLVGKDLDWFWSWVGSRAAEPGEADRPEAVKSTKLLPRLRGLARIPFERTEHRVDLPKTVVLVSGEDQAARRASLLRIWDLCGRLEYQVDEDLEDDSLRLRDAGDNAVKVMTGDEAGRRLIRLLPGLWLVYPLAFVPGGGKLALRILSQK